MWNAEDHDFINCFLVVKNSVLTCEILVFSSIRGFDVENFFYSIILFPFPGSDLERYLSACFLSGAVLAFEPYC